MVSVRGMREFGYADAETFQSDVAVRCLNAAKEYLANAGVRERESALYDQAVYMLAMHWYDNRNVDIIGQVRGEVSHGLQSIIHQLNWSEGAGQGYTPVTAEGA